MSSWFVTKDGRRFSPEQRKASSKKTRAAIAQGIIPRPEKCNRCGQTEGYVSYHNHDYADPIKYLECLCIRCHMILHSEHFAPDACTHYWNGLKAGVKWPGLEHRQVFAALERDHGIRHPRRCTPCQRCGQHQGLMRVASDMRTRLCWMCYTVEQVAHPEAAVQKYVAHVESGKRFPPVFKPDYAMLREVFGVYWNPDRKEVPL